MFTKVTGSVDLPRSLWTKTIRKDWIGSPVEEILREDLKKGRSPSLYVKEMK